MWRKVKNIKRVNICERVSKDSVEKKYKVVVWKEVVYERKCEEIKKEENIQRKKQVENFQREN